VPQGILEEVLGLLEERDTEIAAIRAGLTVLIKNYAASENNN